MWLHPISSWRPIGSATRWSRICAARSRLHQQHAGDDRRLCLAFAGRGRPPRLQRPCRRPPRRQSRSQADHAAAPAARHRQSRQPERAGRPAKYPVYAAYGTTVGFDQSFNRFQIAAGATVDRTAYTNSKLTDGSTFSNDDRDFNQYGGVGRFSYDLKPGLKPFVEIQGDTRVHDLAADRNGYFRDSNGGYAKVGTSFEFSRILIGEVSVGYSARNYVDPRLSQLAGFLTSGSLIWSASGLTTVKFATDTQIAETTVPGSSGVLVHTYGVEVDHDFRRWLTAVGKFTYGTYDYQGQNRNDKTYSFESNLIYKLNRNIWIKGTLRHDILDSNQPGSSSQATVVMVGVRLQN